MSWPHTTETVQHIQNYTIDWRYREREQPSIQLEFAVIGSAFHAIFFWPKFDVLYSCYVRLGRPKFTNELLHQQSTHTPSNSISSGLDFYTIRWTLLHWLHIRAFSCYIFGRHVESVWGIKREKRRMIDKAKAILVKYIDCAAKNFEIG